MRFLQKNGGTFWGILHLIQWQRNLDFHLDIFETDPGSDSRCKNRLIRPADLSDQDSPKGFKEKQNHCENLKFCFT